MNKKQFWEFVNAKNDQPAELLIYGDIFEWDDDSVVSSKDFARQLKEISSKVLNVRINSGGGSVFTGEAIYTMLKGFKGKVNIYIDAFAGSIASVIAMAGYSYAPRNTMMWIHNPMSGSWGYAKDLRKTADELDKMRDMIAQQYIDKTGLEKEKILSFMEEETLFTAQEAHELGFIDEILDPIEMVASFDGHIMKLNGGEFDLNKIKKLPTNFFSTLKKTDHTDLSNRKNNEETKPMNIDKLKAEHPELYAQVLNLGKEEGVKAGIEQERTRIKEIEDIAKPGYENLVVKAKFENGLSAQALAVEILKADKAQKDQHTNNTQADAQDLNGLGAGSNLPEPDAAKAKSEKEEEDKLIAAAASGFSNRRKKTFRKGE